MIDSHAHLEMCGEDTDAVVEEARAAGLSRILTIGLKDESNLAAIEHAARFEEVFAAVGRHPNATEGFDDAAADRIRELAGDERVVAIGETGLDYFRNGSPRQDQRRAFAAQASIAAEASLPLVIHMRDEKGETEAADEVFESLADHPGPVVLHCFSAPTHVEEAARRGWYCSFAGNVTYPASGDLREAAAKVPDELILVETDCPYLSPQPFRGKPNRPANVTVTAATVAEVRGVEPTSLDELVERNAAALFGW